MNYFQLQISLGKNYIIGVNIFIRFYSYKNDKRKILCNDILSLGTYNAGKITVSNIRKIILEKITNAGLAILENSLVEEGIYNFEQNTYTHEFINSILDDFRKMELGDIKKLTEYKVHSESFPTKIIIFNQKHYNRYFSINHPNDVYKIFLKMLKENFNNDYYEWMKYHTHAANNIKPTYTLEDINSLPETMASEKQLMLSNIKKWEKDEKESEEIRQLYVNIQKSIDTNDGKSAYDLIREMRNRVYEDFEVVESESY